MKKVLSETSIYICWKNIKKRCLNPNNKAYKNYGGRGITICDEWKNSFQKFYSDMGEKPGDEYTIERKDNEKGYSKDNCIWALRKHQSRNRRTNRIIEYNGEKLILQDLATKFNVSHDNIIQHLKTKTVEEMMNFYNSGQNKRYNKNGNT